MNLPEAGHKNNLMYDFYEALLTQKQRDVFSARYADDCSYSEIGETLGITPQAVVDILKRTTANLNKYETLLGLVAKHETQQAAVEEIKRALDNCIKTKEIEEVRLLVNDLLL